MEAVPGSRAVRRQLLASDGVMGLSMLAEPLTKHYATLSVWRDAAALDAFACAHPHGSTDGRSRASDGPNQVRPLDDQGYRWPAIVDQRA